MRFYLLGYSRELEHGKQTVRFDVLIKGVRTLNLSLHILRRVCGSTDLIDDGSAFRTISVRGSPPFFDGLLPEGAQLEGLLRLRKIDREKYHELVESRARRIGLA